ncbi:MAG: hypothetical protein ACW986_12440 [Promethearchaeota archaeon]|jgi:hypothetical protein
MIICFKVPEAAINMLQKEKLMNARVHAAPGFQTLMGSFLYFEM